MLLDVKPLNIVNGQISRRGIRTLNESAFNGAWHDFFLVDLVEQISSLPVRLMQKEMRAGQQGDRSNRSYKSYRSLSLPGTSGSFRFTRKPRRKKLHQQQMG